MRTLLLGLVGLMLGGCASQLETEYDANPAAHTVSVREAPFEELAAEKESGSPAIVNVEYATAKTLGLSQPEGRMQLQLDAARCGADSVRWGRRMIAPGQPMPPSVNVNMGQPYYQPYYNRGGFDPSANANAMVAGMNAGANSAATQAAIYASMPDYEYLIVFYKTEAK